MKLGIATGRSRRETFWKNKEYTWGDLVKKLSNTHRTHETFKDYMAMKKDMQDNIKDVGGFVGGYLSSGRRKAGTVLTRQLITLDIDFAGKEFWDDFTLGFDNAAVVYSTHKHSSEAPRFRLVMPLNREVRPDEYEAICRRIAGIIDIEVFDPTTFQPERLMYWPSTSSDGEFFFRQQEGPWLDADKILSSYRDWQDVSQWPMSAKVDKIIRAGIKKQGDPLEKPGVVGAFCKAYPISEAIAKFLPDVYTPCTQGRYSYAEGSTAGGVVTYDDKFSYSHHGSDPTSNKLCNAFDLVRLHKYGIDDLEAKEGTPVNKMPSYQKMLDISRTDQRVKKILLEDKIADARSDFGVMQDDEDPDWQKKLDVDKKGNVYGTIDNILLILENDPYLKGRIGYDDFEKCEVAIAELPWRKVTPMTRRLADKDDSAIRYYLEKTYGISNKTKTEDAMSVHAIRESFHPVRDYLNGLEWDGEARMERLLIDYQGAEDTEYTRTVTRKMLIAAVARVFEPGVKFDYVLVLVGDQGMKKSSLVGKLGLQWFSDSFSTVDGKEAFEQLQGVWLVEMAELSALHKQEVEKIKHFITKREDRYRVAYGKRVEKFPRQCVFFATTNKRDFLRDPTGDRRYWPVMVNITTPVKDVFKDLTTEEIGQIWAEAMVNYELGENLYLEPKMAAKATQIQKDHTAEHPWMDAIRNYLNTKIPVDWNRWELHERLEFLKNHENYEGDVKQKTRVCVPEIWREALNQREIIDERSAITIRNILRNIDDWEEIISVQKYGSYGPQRRGFILRIEA